MAISSGQLCRTLSPTVTQLYTYSPIFPMLIEGVRSDLNIWKRGKSSELRRFATQVKRLVIVASTMLQVQFKIVGHVFKVV